MSQPKKYETGEAIQYITRKHALRKLQLTSNDFRRLCIIKGIYPREPKDIHRAQKDASDIQILYHTKDIRFLLHEPIISTLRKYKIFATKTGRDRAVKDFKKLKRRLNLYPELKIDHVVKERYPTFIDAIKDLDDCLTLLFLFSTFPTLHLVPKEQSTLCRRLTIEFLHYVIATKALRKVFVSIKGYYFQANIKGQLVTWIVPHHYPFEPYSKPEVDFKVMSIFVEFYTIMLGFVNYRLYNSLNLIYPPQLPSNVVEDIVTSEKDMNAFVDDRIAALNMDLIKIDRSVVEDDEENDIDLDLLAKSGDPQRVKKMKEEIIKVKLLKNLFKGLKFFINREVPREPLVLIIRCFGGQVSWDKNTFPGATFDEDDKTITHQIVDRQSLVMECISRAYIQSQWVFDCVNKGILLPTNKYLIGAELPPHLSPFIDSKHNKCIPPKEKTLRDPSLINKEDKTNEQFTAEQLEQIYKNEIDEIQKELEENEEDDDDDDGGDDDDDYDDYDDDGEEGEEEENTNSDVVEGSGSDDDDEDDKEKKREKETKTMTEGENAIEEHHLKARKSIREQQPKGKQRLQERKRRQIEIKKELLKKKKLNDDHQQQQKQEQPQQQQEQQEQSQQQQTKQDSTEVCDFQKGDFQNVSEVRCDETSDRTV